MSPHAINVSLNYLTSPNATLSVSHTYRDKAYAASDFSNSFNQKLDAYHATNIGYRYRYEAVELSAQVDNLFEQSNGLWISDDVIYPVNFERTWRIGIKAQL